MIAMTRGWNVESVESVVLFICLFAVAKRGEEAK
jgi:hypothetical protein